MTRLRQIAVALGVCGLLLLSPLAPSLVAEQDAAVAKQKAAVVVDVVIDVTKKADVKVDEKAQAEEKKKEEVKAEEKKKVAEALKKAMDPKKAAALAEKAEREKKDKKTVNKEATEKAKKDAEDAELKALLPQFEQQVRPLVRSRYNFLRAVAQPTKEQRAKIVVGAEDVHKTVVRAFAEMQLKMQRGQWNGDSKYPNGQQLVSDRFSTIAKECLNADQLERYTKEVDKKNENYKAVCVKNLVAMIDHQLVLSPDQRDKIADELTKKWDKTWVQSLEVFMYGEQFMPQLPDNVLIPHLNDLQKQVWKATPRNSGMIWGGFGFMWGNQQDDGPLDKDFPKVEKPKEEKPVDAQAKAKDEKPKEEKPKEEKIEAVEKAATKAVAK